MDEPRHMHMTIPVRVITALALSGLGSLVLEAGTVFGSFTMSVRDLSMWMPKRILVFFALLLVPVFLLVTYLPTIRGGVHVRHLARNALALVAGCIGGTIVGFFLSVACGNAGDPRYGIVIACIATAALLLFINRDLIRTSFEWCFLILALCFGTVFCIFMPTASEISWDGSIHFKNANAVSYLFDAEYTGADQIMVIGGEQGALYLTGSLLEIEHDDVELEARNVSFPHARLAYEDVVSSNDSLRRAETSAPVIKMNGNEVYPYGTTLSVSSIGVIPNACGLWLGRALRLDCVGRYFLARLTSMLFYVIVFFFAIRFLKHGKLVLTVIGLCPTSLFMAANFSYDPWITCLLSFSFALFVGSLQRNTPMPWSRSLTMLGAFVLGACVKPVIAPLALIFFFAPRRLFNTRRDRVLYACACVASIALLMLSFALPFFVSISQGKAARSDARGGTGVSSTGQVAYVFTHPFEALGMGVVFTLRMLNPLRLGFGITHADENLLHYFPYLIPTYAPLNELLAGIEYLLLILYSVIDGGPSDESFKDVRFKLATLAATGLTFTLIAGAMYVSFTAVGRNTIAGVQYRYLLPLLAPLALLLPNTRFRRAKKTDWPAYALCAIECLALSAVTINAFVLWF